MNIIKIIEIYIVMVNLIGYRKLLPCFLFNLIASFSTLVIWAVFIVADVVGFHSPYIELQNPMIPSKFSYTIGNCKSICFSPDSYKLLRISSKIAIAYFHLSKGNFICNFYLCRKMFAFRLRNIHCMKNKFCVNKWNWMNSVFLIVSQVTLRNQKEFSRNSISW